LNSPEGPLGPVARPAWGAESVVGRRLAAPFRRSEKIVERMRLDRIERPDSSAGELQKQRFFAFALHRDMTSVRSGA